jgi:hypothetical protein
MFFLVYGFFCICVLTGVSLIIIGLSKPGDNFLINLAYRIYRKYFPTTALVLIVVLTIPVAAWAGEYFNPAEQKEIRRTVRAVFPRAEVDFKDTEIKGAGVLIGPLPDGSNIFIHANSGTELFIYKPPPEYEQKVWKIIKTVYSIVDNRPASVALRGNPLK